MRRGIVSLVLACTCATASFAAQIDDGVWRTDWSNYIVHPDSFIRFGEKDAIPALFYPAFESIASARAWLNDREPVAVVFIGGTAKAYPVQILMHHDAVNDTVSGTPVSVTFCILCGSAVAFDRRFDGHVLEFAIAGQLYNSNLVLYDRQTETWWGQAVGQGLVGRYAGERLPIINAPVMSFRDFRRTHPDGRVLSRNTGFDRDYGKGRMVDYEDRGPLERVFRREADIRLPAKERVLVVEAGEDIVAFPYRALGERHVLTTMVGGRDVVVFWAPGTASIYAERTADGRDVGAALAYSPVLDGRRLRFRAADEGRFLDRETGSTWMLTGEAVDGPLTGRQLDPVEHGVHFWFVWAAYRPTTRVVER